ncbi:MAG: (d)CMP kinase [Bacillota bacterium]
MPKKFSIAIDGPAGAGKSTVARGVASVLGYRYVDTGAMYRAVTLSALERNIDLDDGRALSELANKAKIDIIENSGENILVLLNGVDVSEKIRDPLVTKNVSRVASVPGVRKALVAAQRAMAANGGVVMEGRDIGTVVIPDAPYKFYIVASACERARRRARDYEKMGLRVNMEKLIADIERRDRIDSSREVDPLRPAEDAQIIDCTGMTADEVINLIVKRVTEGRA